MLAGVGTCDWICHPELPSRFFNSYTTEVVGSECYGNSYDNRIIMHEPGQKTNCRMLACSSVHTRSSRVSLNSLFCSVYVLGYPQSSPGLFLSHCFPDLKFTEISVFLFKQPTHLQCNCLKSS